MDTVIPICVMLSPFYMEYYEICTNIPPALAVVFKQVLFAFLQCFVQCIDIIFSHFCSAELPSLHQDNPYR